MIVMAATGPLVVHFEIRVDGRPQRAVLDGLLEEALDICKGDNAAHATWSALVARPLFSSGVLGNQPVADAASRDRVTRDFDFNRDDRVDRDELAAWLARDFVRGRSFSVEWTDDSADDDWNAPLFVLLDADEDGRLSAEEMAAAPQRLRSRDVDDNDSVTLADFSPPASNNRAMVDGADVRPSRAFELRELVLDPVFYALYDLYDAGQGLDAESFALTPGLVAALDANQSGKVEQRELSGLMAARPDLVVRIDFHSTGDARSEPTIELVATSDDLENAGVRPQSAARRLIVAQPRSQLEIYAIATDASAERNAATAALFGQLDADKNESLEADELSSFVLPAGVTIVDADKDGDAKVSLGELQAAWSTRATYRDVQALARVGAAGDPLFGWLDVQPDGRLTSRELSAAGRRLAELDANGDDFVAPAEIPDQLVCAVVLGGGEARDRREESPTALKPRRAAEMPRWLAAMDQNLDGEVSRREFLGTPRQFAEFDANGDGFLEASEVSPPSGAQAPASKPSRDVPPADTPPVDDDSSTNGR